MKVIYAGGNKTETHTEKIIDSEKEVCGFNCYGETKSESDTLMGAIFEAKANLWYSKDLYFPYRFDSRFSHSSIVYKNNICLQMEIDTRMATFGIAEDTTIRYDLWAEKVMHLKIPAELFQLPSNYLLQMMGESEIPSRSHKTPSKTNPKQKAVKG